MDLVLQEQLGKIELKNCEVIFGYHRNYHVSTFQVHLRPNNEGLLLIVPQVLPQNYFSLHIFVSVNISAICYGAKRVICHLPPEHSRHRY